MFRKHSLLLAVLPFLLVAPMAQAAGGWSISVGGGLGIPVGDFSNEADFDASLGFMISPAVDYMVNDMLSVGVDGAFAQNKLNKDDRDAYRTAFSDPTFDIKYTQIGGGVHGKYWFPMQNSPVSSYLIGGVGATNFKAEVDSNDPLVAGEQSKTGFSARIGLGAGYKASEQVTLGVEGGYNFLSLNKDDWGGTSSAPSFGVTGVVTFTIKPAQ